MIRLLKRDSQFTSCIAPRLRIKDVFETHLLNIITSICSCDSFQLRLTNAFINKKKVYGSLFKKLNMV